MTRALPFLLVLLSACPGEGPDTSSSSDTSSSTGTPPSSTSESGESSGTTGDESSSTTGAEEVCAEIYGPETSNLYLLCSVSCGDCFVDELHVKATCATIPQVAEPSAVMCVNLCENDGWCSGDEICVLTYDDLRLCVPKASQQ